MLCINFFIATAFPQMLHVTGSVEVAKDLNSQFAAFLPAGGIVYIPLIGTLGSQIEKLNQGGTEHMHRSYCWVLAVMSG